MRKSFCDGARVGPGLEVVYEDREHRVTRERWVVGAVEHDGRDHGHLDRGSRHGEDEGAVGFPEPLREPVGVAHDGERAPEHDAEDPREDDSADGTPVHGRREVVTEAPEDRGGGESGQDGDSPRRTARIG